MRFPGGGGADGGWAGAYSPVSYYTASRNTGLVLDYPARADYEVTASRATRDHWPGSELRKYPQRLETPGESEGQRLLIRESWGEEDLQIKMGAKLFPGRGALGSVNVWASSVVIIIAIHTVCLFVVVCLVIHRSILRAQRIMQLGGARSGRNPSGPFLGATGIST